MLVFTCMGRCIKRSRSKYEGFVSIGKELASPTPSPAPRFAPALCSLMSPVSPGHCCAVRLPPVKQTHITSRALAAYLIVISSRMLSGTAYVVCVCVCVLSINMAAGGLLANRPRRRNVTSVCGVVLQRGSYNCCDDESTCIFKRWSHHLRRRHRRHRRRHHLLSE